MKLRLNPLLVKNDFTKRKTLTNQSMLNLLKGFNRIESRGFAFKTNTEKRLSSLEDEANENPTNAVKQAAFYQELLKGGYYNILINRLENYDFGINVDCLQYYITALIKNNQTDSIATKVLKLIQTKPFFRSMEHSTLTQTFKKPSTPTFDNTTSTSSGTKDKPVHVIVDESSSVSMWKAIKSVGLTFTYIFCILTFISLALENSGLAKSPPKIQPEFEPDMTSTVTFNDVQGVDEAKDELIEIVEFLKDPSRFNELGGKLPKGVLLTGPPGTGKTLLARAVAGEAGVPFFFMSGSEFDEMYVGVGARRVRELFAAARKKAPSIVFIDELDAIGAKRNPKDQAYMKQTLNQLLVDLDGFSQTEGVIFIAATNFPELLDKALVRPGRFDRHVEVPLPDVRGRLQVLKLHSKKIQIGQDVDLSTLARGTPGFSGAELANLVNLAAIQASRSSSPVVNLSHFEEAKDRMIMGAERKSAVITDESKKLTAYHEGGHALVAYYTPGALPLHKATIIPRGRSLGVTMQLPEMDKDNYTKKELKAMLDVCMGGRVAEEVLYGEENVTSGAQSDLQKATSIARRMVIELGMGTKLGPVDYSGDYDRLSHETKLEIENQVRKLLDDAYMRATSLITTKKSELDRLAAALIEFETLSAEQMANAMKGKNVGL
ncbi:ATP-dependent metallopeptidase Hfl [Neoconidiobolus thromboides FSU 785]|nr:ATP-dependent metallopeptidase Hfl [Neoconidiobolus thromboides FSU 785]